MKKSEWQSIKPLLESIGVKFSEVSHHRGDPGSPFAIGVMFEKFPKSIMVDLDEVQEEPVSYKRHRK